MERLIDARGLRQGIAWPGLRRRRGRRRRRTLGMLLRRRTLRRRVLAVMVVLALLLLSWIGLRRSPLVSITHVRVSGVHGLYGAQIERALTAAAKRQSTMVLDVRALRAAVAPYGVVRDLRVNASFPHTLHITVIEQLPVATLISATGHAAVAGDGTVLAPTVPVAGTPAISVPALPGQHVSDPSLLSELEALAPAPAPLLRRVTGIFLGPQGLTLTMRSGLQIYFGDSSTAHAKWIAAALVIGDRSSIGARYVDVRLPDRPSAGGLPPASPATAGAVAGRATTGPTTQADLVATLAAALAGSSPGSTGAPGAGAVGGAASAPGGAATTTPAGAGTVPPSTPASSAAPASGTPGGVSSSTGG